VSGSGEPIGKALVDRGIVQPNDLWKCLHEQVTAVFHALLLSPSGTFFLVDEDPGDRMTAPLAVSTQSLLMDGIRRIDELSLFRARIPGPRAYLRRREPSRAVTLRPTETALLALVDGRTTVAQIATAAHMNEFDATKILYHLARRGTSRPPRSPRRPATGVARSSPPRTRRCATWRARRMPPGSAPSSAPRCARSSRRPRRASPHSCSGSPSRPTAPSTRTRCSRAPPSCPTPRCGASIRQEIRRASCAT
jgi:hypothetical protein